MVEPVRSATVTSAALRQIKDDSSIAKARRRRISQIDRTWQTEAFDMTDKVGELGYIIELQSNSLALCDFPIRRWDEETESWAMNDPAEKETFDRRPVNVMEAFLGPTGDQKELYRRAAYNIFTAGEVNLLGTPVESNQGILWEFLSIDELTVDAEGNYIRRPTGIRSEGGDRIEGDHYVARCWRSDARFSQLATSEVRRVLTICQEIVTLTMMIDAISKSRISANLLFIPDELMFATQTDAETDSDGNDIDPFIEELLEHLSAPITDPSSAARLVPLVIRGKAELGKEIRVIELSRSLDMVAQDLRKEALGRLAGGIDAPPEMMTGFGSVNHWTGAIIGGEFLVKHVQPIGQMLADFVTIAYLRPMLEAYEGMSTEEAAMWKVEFDPSAVMARVDEAKSARDLAPILSDEALVLANGFTKADMASEEERTNRRIWELVTSNPQIWAGLVSRIPGLEDVDVATLPQPGGGAAAPEAAPDAADVAAPASGEPVDPTAKVTGTKNMVDKTSGGETPEKPEELSLLMERLASAADSAMRHAIDRAGSKLISRAQNDPLRDRIRNVRKDRVMSLVSQADIARFGLTRDKLLDHAWDELAVMSRAWIRAHLEAEGMPAYDADDRAALSASFLCQQMHQLASERMLEPLRTLPNGLLVSHDVVIMALEQGALAGAH